MKPSLWLPLVLALLAMVVAGKPLVVDEESYLAIASQIADHPGMPYDWWRPWQPWGAERVANAYLYAHPPLHLWWVAGWRGLLGEGAALRLGVTLPWALLLGFSVGRLCQRFCRRPHLAALVWGSSPILLLALHAGLMVDLGVVALGSSAVVAWLAAQDRERICGGRAALAGVLLGLACSYKYPALVLLPVLGVHALGLRRLRQSWPTWLAFGVVWGGLQGFLALKYGSFHLLHVLSTAPEIERGGGAARAFGTLVRLGLVLCPLALLGARVFHRGLVLGVAVGLAGVFAFMGPDRLPLLDQVLLVFLATGGCALLVRSVWATLRAGQDELLLGAWALAVVLSVVCAHNYVGGRYLLPAQLPLAIMAVRSLESRRQGQRWLGVGLVLWVPLGGGLAWSDYRQARAVEDLATQVAEAWPVGVFTGEWTFRREMERRGWEKWVPPTTLEPGVLLAEPENSSPSALPSAGLELRERLESADRFPLRILDQGARIGYQSETLGILPFGFSGAPLEVVRVYEVVQ